MQEPLPSTHMTDVKVSDLVFSNEEGCEARTVVRAVVAQGDGSVGAEYHKRRGECHDAEGTRVGWVYACGEVGLSDMEMTVFPSCWCPLYDNGDGRTKPLGVARRRALYPNSVYERILLVTFHTAVGDSDEETEPSCCSRLCSYIG